MSSGDHPAADSCGRTAIGAGVAGAEGMYGLQAGGDVRPVPVQYGLRRAGAPAVADGLSSAAAGVEQTRSRLPVLRASVRSPLYGGNGSPAIPVRLAKLDRSQDARLSIIRKGGPEFDTVLSLSGRAAATDLTHGAVSMLHAHSHCPPPHGQ